MTSAVAPVPAGPCDTGWPARRPTICQWRPAGEPARRMLADTEERHLRDEGQAEQAVLMRSRINTFAKFSQGT